MKARVLRKAMSLGLALGLGLALPLGAHEFWLLPEDFTIDPQAQVRVSLRNGQHMVGTDLPYLPENLPRFEILPAGAEPQPIAARTGDMPAIVLPAPAPGLAIVVAETIDLPLPYEDFGSFQRFVEHKAITGALDLHRARGLPETGFTETFRRHAKTLVAIGDGAGADRPVGLRIEIVALANPYTDDLSAGLPLLVLLDGQPRANARMALFETAPDGTVTETPYTTDAQGRVTVPVRPGATYLADSVDLFALPNDDPAAGPVWHSDWASLTFAVP